MNELDVAVHGILVPGFEGTTAPGWVLRRLERGLAGVVLFARNCGPDLRGLTDVLHGVREDVLVAVDEEGGDVTRLEADVGSRHPGALALGTADDVVLTRRVASSIGALLRESGIDWNWAPVADVTTNPLNPVIGVRSFGTEPTLVARHVAATVDGLQEDAGILACAKHFPGHGDTDVDSHLGLPTVSASRADLDAGALVPFRAAIDAGVATVMTGHLRMLALDPHRPATFSSDVLRTLLRDTLGFRGVVVSDALEMGGAAAEHGIGEAAVLAVRAGVDALCIGGHLADDEVVALVHAAVIDAVRRGDLDEARVLDAASRVAGLARRHRPSVVSATVMTDAECVAAAGCTLEVAGAVALASGVPLIVVCDPAVSIAAGMVPWGITGALASVRGDARETLLHEGDPTPGELTPAGPVVLVLRDAARHLWQRDVERTVVGARPDTVVVELGVPALPPPTPAARITAYGASRSTAEAVVALLTHHDGGARP